jgi:hypothetical protein
MYLEPTTNTSRLSPLDVKLIYLHGILAYTSSQMCARYTHEKEQGSQTRNFPLCTGMSKAGAKSHLFRIVFSFMHP